MKNCAKRKLLADNFLFPFKFFLMEFLSPNQAGDIRS